MPSQQTLDDALVALYPYGCSLANGFTNHAPMVAEVLFRHNQPNYFEIFLGSYQGQLVARPELKQPVSEQNWHLSLSQLDRFSDWSAFIAEQMTVASWQAVLNLWVARFSPAFVAGATHGVIRTGHAVRALQQKDTPARRLELADALSSWASEYEILPIAPIGILAQIPIAQAIGRIPLVPEPLRRNDGAITRALGSLKQVPDFAPAVSVCDLSGEAHRVLYSLGVLFARIFITSADKSNAIAFVHAITATAAVCQLAPVLQPQVLRSLIWRAWEAGCAIYATYSKGGQLKTGKHCSKSPEELFNQALVHGDEHVLKVAEASLNFYQQTPDSALLAATDLCAQLIG